MQQFRGALLFATLESRCALSSFMPSSSSSCGAFLVASTSPMLTSRRWYRTVLKGKDELQPDLWKKLGFTKDDESRLLDRTPKELRLQLLRAAKDLDPEKSAKDARRLELLVDTFKKLANDDFRLQYAAYPSSSLDAKLHVLVEGGQVSTNFNPEHQSFDYMSKGEGERTFGEFKEAYHDATGTPMQEGRMHSAADRRKPFRGSDINFTLRLSFDEAMHGCHKVVQYKRRVVCRMCRGSGEKDTKVAPRCKLCSGKGKHVLPSGTYLIEKPCDHCGGEGTTARPRCGSCGGMGCTMKSVTLPVDVAAGSSTMSSKVVPSQGDDGTRGGASGNLIVTLMVEEHRLFHRSGDDLHIAAPVPLSVALLGGFISVPSLRGMTKVRVPAGLRNGEVITLDGLGVKSRTTDTVGKLKVHAVVVVPHGGKLTGRQRRAMEVLAGPCESNVDVHSDSDKDAAPVTANERLQRFADMKTQFSAWFSAR